MPYQQKVVPLGSAGVYLSPVEEISGLDKLRYTVPIEKKKIKPNLLDQAESAWSNVSIPVRDLLLQPASDSAREIGLRKVSKGIDWASDVLNPDSIVVDGKRQGVENKTFNNLSIPELKKEVNAYTTTPDKANGIIYQIRDVNTGDIKWGRSQEKDAFGRWGADKNFGENFEVLQEIPVTDMHYVERLIHGNKNMIKTQTYGWGDQKNSPLTGGGTEIYTNDPLSKESISKVQQLLNPEQIGLAERVYEQLSTVGRKWKLAGQNAGKARIESMGDQYLGAGIGIQKAVGGLANLLGDEYGQKKAQRQATQQSNMMTNKDSLSATVGEILPEFGLPAVGYVSKGANLGRRIIQGAGSGAVITGGYEALKEQSGIKEGLETNVAMATGIGGVIGGIVGGLTKNPALGKTIGEAFVAGDDKAKEAILQTYPEARGAVEQYFKNNGLAPSKTQPAYLVEDNINPVTGDVLTTKVNRDGVTKSDTIEPDITPLQKKQTVKPMKEKSTTTKNGVEITSDEVIAGKKKIEDVEFQAVSPKDKEGKPLSNQTYVPEVNNPMKFKYGYDADGRVYPEESHLLSPQGDATQMASLEQKAKPKIESAEAEVQRRTQFYDTSESLRQRYGQAQASYKESGTLSEKQMEANRLQFEKDQYAQMMRDKDLPKDVRTEARTKLSELNKIEVKDYKPTKLQVEKAKEKEIAQHRVSNKSQEAYKAREKEIATEYSIYKESKKTRNKEGYVAEKTKTPEEIVSKITENAKELSVKASKAKKEVEKKVAELGQKFDMKNITDEQRKMFRDEIGNIEDIQNARIDLTLFKDGKIDADQLQFREKRRIEERLKREKKDTFKSKEEAEAYKDSLTKQYEDIGIYVKKEDIKLNKPRTKSTKPETKEKKDIREKKEIEDSEMKHNNILGALKDYQETKEVPRYRTTEKAGQRRLTDAQMKQVDEGVLTLDEIADQSAPIGKLEDIDKLKTQAKEKSGYLHTEAKQNELGLEWKTRPKNIKFKDTLQDVSNSVGQITSVLLGSKNLAKVTKIGGKDSLRMTNGKVADLRNIIAEGMEKILPKNFPIKPSKETVKSTFMTENYGQGRKGLLRNIQKEYGVSKEESEQFLKAYDESFNGIAPEMKELASRLKESFLKSDGVIHYDMPDGFPVRFQVKKKLDGSYSIKGENNPVKIETNSIDEFSTGILPNVIQSADSFIARYMNKHGIVSKHDAFMTPAGKTDAYVRRIYGQAMAELNKHDVLGKVFESLGDMKGSPKIGDLKSTEIKLSARKSEALEPEEVAGMVTKADAREIDLSKVNKSKTEVMKEFMAKDNVRQASVNQLPKVLAHESGLRTMSVAKSGDDVFERQFALAHQSPIYNPRKSLKAPKGADAKEWDKAQREIFNEARARLENNPLLNGKIQGERKFFTENGKLVGDKTKTYHELLREEIVKGNLEIRRLNREAKKAVKQIAPTYEKLQLKVKSWEAGKRLNNAEAMAKEVVHNSRQPIAERSVFKKNIDKFKTYFKDQVSDSKVSRDFQKLLTNRTVSETNVAKRAEYLKKDLDTRFKGENQEDLTNAILRTDYHAIQEFKSAEEASKFEDYNKEIYESFKQYIDQSAKAIGESSEQVGFFRNNPKAILAEHNIYKQPVLEEILDKLISIKAMKPKDWETIAKIRDTDDFKFVMDIISDNKKRSAELFHTNPHQQVKGYTSEVYADRFDAETKREAGAIPSTLERKKVGSYEDELPKGEFSNLKEKSEFAEKNRMKVNHNGSFRKVLDAESKDKAGRSKSFNEILAKTSQSIDAKEVQNLLSKKIIDEMVNGNEMFSQTKKEGYRLIKDNEVSAMPKVVGDSLAGRYVREDYDKRLFGRDEVRLYSGSSHIGKVADRLLKNAVEHFKLNVVLKNPNSHVNAILVNQMLGTMSGVNPAKLLKYQVEAFKEMDKVDKLMSKMAILKASGKDFSAVEKELNKSLLYKLEQAGLAVNKLEVGGKSGSFGNKVVDNLYLSQDSKVGKNIYKAFGVYDTQGRYTIAKNALDNGKTIEEAVAEANGLYSDMNQMAPAIIEIADKYGLIPFAKWFSLTAPRLMKLAKENPAKAIALGISMYGLQVETNTNLSTVNPLESVVNFADDAVTPEFANKAIDDGVEEASIHKAKTFFIPKIYSEIYSELVKPEQHDFFLKRQTKGEFQPLTQRIAND